MASTKNGIIYPDNYDKVADVPADMKVLAESVDGNIERINKNLDKNADELKNLQKDNTGNKTAIEAINKKNTEQDTNIQKNAKDIETNQNNIKALQVKNAEVKAENERLRSDIESISLVGEAEGESIDLDDSSGARFNKFEIGGNHKQETREGYNILDLGKKPYNEQASSLNGATVTQKNGILTIDAMNATDLVTVKSVWKSYTDSTNIKMPKANYYTPLTLNISKVESGESVGQKTGNFTLEEDCVCTQWFYNVGKGKKIELPLFISNNQNKTAYEPYGAMPSLKFQSEIKTVKDNVNEVVCNKNLLKITAESVSNWNGLNITILDDKRIKINGTVQGSVNTYDFSLNNYKDVSNLFTLFENSVLSLNLCGGKITNQQNFSVSVVKQNVDGTKTHLQATPSSHKLLVAGKYYWFRLFLNKGTIFENAIIEIQIEQGSISTDHEAHQEQTITMPVQQEMLQGDYFDFENEKEVHTWCKETCNGTEKWIQQQTTSAGYWYIHDVNGKGITSGDSQYILCNKLKGINSKEAWNGINDGINVSNNINIYLKEYSQNKTLEDFKKMLSENPLEIYYKVKTQIELPFTDEQKAIAKKIKETLHTYKNITHIYSTDETNPVLNVEYAKDLNTQNNNLQNQIDEIKQLISTTQTSAMLLDNLQKEVESEVE